MADGNPPRLRGTRCPVAGFSNQPNAQPEMTAKIFRAKPLVRLSYSLNPLGAQFPSAGSMCRLARQPHDPQHRWIYQFRGPWAFPTMYVSRCIAAPCRVTAWFISVSFYETMLQAYMLMWYLIYKIL